jgi:hypothetical protein
MDFSKLSIPVFALGLTACSAGLATPTTFSGPSATGCDLALHGRGGALVLEAKALGPHAAFGQYQFTLEHRSSSGTASIRQSGDFVISSETGESLTEIALSGADTPFDAKLVVTIGGETHTCARAGL